MQDFRGRGHRIWWKTYTDPIFLQQERVVAIPGAQNVEQLRENLKVLDFTLTNDEMAAISALARGTRIVNPKHGPAWDPA